MGYTIDAVGEIINAPDQFYEIFCQDKFSKVAFILYNEYAHD